MRRGLVLFCVIVLGLAIGFALNGEIAGPPPKWSDQVAAERREMGIPPAPVNNPNLAIPEYVKGKASWTVGPPEAKVKVDVYYPGQGHDSIEHAAKYLAESFPNQVCVRYVDWEQPSGAREWGARGLRCGAVVINNKQVFEVETKTGKRQIVFHGPPGEEKVHQWRIPDLHLVVSNEVEKAYGPGAGVPTP